MSSPGSQDNDVLAKVEDVFEKIIDSLCREEPIAISLKYKPKPQRSASQENANTDIKIRSHAFPGATPQEAWRFTVLFRLLGLIHEALTSRNVVSKRNIFYKDPALFKSQAVVDRYVDVLAYTFGLQRAALNITAAAKGLAVGNNLTITRPNGSIVTRGLDNKPFLVDDQSEISTLKIPNVSWILVVEKESTFRTLASNLLHRTCRAGNGVIITAKGYPDISTRSFLRHLSTANVVPPPIYALTDFDPDGIAIMSVFKHGSFALSHENAHLNVSTIEWLGVRSRDLLFRSGTSGRYARAADEDDDDGDDPAGLLRLSARDRKKALNMLANSAVFAEEDREGVEKEWRRELQVMLMLNVKAEMEILAERKGAGGVEGWVERMLVEKVGSVQTANEHGGTRPWLL